MKKIEIIKKLHEETGFPMGMISSFVASDEDITLVRRKLMKCINEDVIFVAKSLEQDLKTAENLYFQYNCSAKRAIEEGKKANTLFKVEDKKTSIEVKLSKGDALLGKKTRNEEENYRWIRIQRNNDIFYVEKFEFSKQDIERCLDLLYSDALYYNEVEVHDIEDVFLIVENEVGIKNFDTYKAASFIVSPTTTPSLRGA